MREVRHHTERTVDGTVDQIVATILGLLCREGSNKFAVYTLDHDANVYFQLAASDARGSVIRAEVASNRFLGVARRLDAAAERYLAGLGWAPPTEGRSPNWFRDVSIATEDDVRRLAHDLFRTIEVYGWRAGDRLHERVSIEADVAPA